MAEDRDDEIAHVSVEKYLGAHSRQNGGLKSFFHSNLFTALVIFLLGQAVLLGLAIGSTYWKTANLIEWKGGVDANIKQMNDQGTNHSHWTDEQQGKEIAVLQAQMEKLKDYNAQFEVIKSEHRRLTKDVEELKNERKQRP